MSTNIRVRGRRLQQRRRTYFAAHPLCVCCRAKGRTSLATELDHITPLAKGGTDEPSNWQGLCEPCHKDKTAKDFGTVRRSGCDANGIPLDPSHPWNATRGAT